jgi:hypothetical protein
VFAGSCVENLMYNIFYAVLKLQLVLKQPQPTNATTLAEKTKTKKTTQTTSVPFNFCQVSFIHQPLLHCHFFRVIDKNRLHCRTTTSIIIIIIIIIIKVMKRYSTVSDVSETDTSSFRRGDMESISVASNRRRFKGHKRLSSDLSEPLTTAGTSVVDESLGSEGGDPYFMFRNDLQKKLELMEESLADFLRVVHESVRQRVIITVCCS